jgi:hypothetical protein
MQQTRLIKSVLGVISCITTFRCASQFTDFNCKRSRRLAFYSLDSNSHLLSHIDLVCRRTLLIHTEKKVYIDSLLVFCAKERVRFLLFVSYIIMFASVDEKQFILVYDCSGVCARKSASQPNSLAVTQKQMHTHHRFMHKSVVVFQPHCIKQHATYVQLFLA